PRGFLTIISSAVLCMVLGLGPQGYGREAEKTLPSYLPCFHQMVETQFHARIQRPRPRGFLGRKGRDLLGTNIAPLSLDSSVAAWVEAEWIPRDRSLALP
ncbi:unnamed protein product, partial [Prunus brigantina]